MISAKMLSYKLRNLFILGTDQTYRLIHTSGADLVRAYTREPNPIPGSDEHLNPDGWAKKLFKLEENKSKMKAESEPHFLHMICRLKPLKGIIHYQRAILEKYGLGQDAKGLLNQTDDLTKCRLLPDGRFFKNRGTAVEGTLTGSENVLSINKEITNPTEIFTHDSPRSVGYLKRSYLRQWNNRSWGSSRLFKEFFASHYKYKLNQDGKQYRYSKLWRLDNAMFDSIKSKTNVDGTFKGPNVNRFDADWNTYPWSKY